MKNVIELDQDEVITAISMYLEVVGAAADVGTIKFAFDGKGEVLVTLEGDRAEEEDLDHVEGKDLDHETVKLAEVQRDSVDFLSKEPLLRGTKCVWIVSVGLTVMLPRDWPEGVRTYHALTVQQLLTVTAWLGKKLVVPEVSAADLLDQIQERFGERAMAVARCLQDSLDFVSEEVLLANTQAVWFEDHGVTLTPVEDWPDEWIEVFERIFPLPGSSR